MKLEERKINEWIDEDEKERKMINEGEKKDAN